MNNPDMIVKVVHKLLSLLIWLGYITWYIYIYTHIYIYIYYIHIYYIHIHIIIAPIYNWVMSRNFITMCWPVSAWNAHPSFLLMPFSWRQLKVPSSTYWHETDMPISAHFQRWKIGTFSLHRQKNDQVTAHENGCSQSSRCLCCSPSSELVTMH